jgi:GPH family glycoside/pentoside/hexuronide:cation symporter
MNSIFGMTIYTITMLALNMLMLKLCTFFGGGELYSRKGWSATVGICAIVYALCVMITFLFTKEMTVAPNSAIKKKQDVVNPIRVVKMLFTNKYWVEYVVGLSSCMICFGLIGGSAVYYAEHVLGNAYSYATLSTALYIAMFLGIIATSLFIKKIGKRNTAIVGLAIMAAGTVISGILPHTVTNGAITLAIRGFGCGFPSALGAAILQDTLTYGKWKNGVDMVGMGNAASSFSSKISGGLAVAIVGWVLTLGGFVSTNAVQTAGTINAIKALFIWIPLLFIAISIIAFVAYKLDKVYAGYAADLSNGKYSPDAILPDKDVENKE